VGKGSRGGLRGALEKYASKVRQKYETVPGKVLDSTIELFTTVGCVKVFEDLIDRHGR
jgi:hypothetical protein